jgi:glutamate-1-semialdehyde 2,1-aminomutase
VYVSGTLNGNPVAAAAGLATLAELERPGTYAQLDAAGARLRAGITALCREMKIPAQILGIASMLNVYFTEHAIHDYRSARTENAALKERLGRELLRRGVITNLGAKMYLSVAHTDSILDRTLAIFSDALMSAVSG